MVKSLVCALYSVHYCTELTVEPVWTNCNTIQLISFMYYLGILSSIPAGVHMQGIPKMTCTWTYCNFCQCLWSCRYFNLWVVLLFDLCFKECIKPVKIEKKEGKRGAIKIEDDGSYSQIMEVLLFVSVYILILMYIYWYWCTWFTGIAISTSYMWKFHWPYGYLGLVLKRVFEVHPLCCLNWKSAQ